MRRKCDAVPEGKNWGRRNFPPKSPLPQSLIFSSMRVLQQAAFSRALHAETGFPIQQIPGENALFRFCAVHAVSLF